jgi:hypothetical protein
MELRKSSVFLRYSLCFNLHFCRFLETVAFTIGSAYFVAGSYPEGVETGSPHSPLHATPDVELATTKNEIIEDNEVKTF